MAKIKFGTDAWVKELQSQLNASPAYEESAKTWEGDFYFLVEPDGAVTEPVYIYLDLWHGKCRDAFIAQDKDAQKPAYVMSGPYARWVKVVTAQLDPLQALATGQLKLKGNMIMVMKHVKAAQEIIKACTRIDTEFAT
jgi:putative sterol carrier protein